MWTGSWLAYGETLRTSAIGAARFLHKATRRHVVRIAITGKGVTIEIIDRLATIVIMGQGPMTETTGQGLTTLQGLTIITTNKWKIDFRSRPHQRSEFSAQWVII
ncbi:hypothetical protein CQ10_37025 [Bradyrhizobium valentinum]|uniref:Uncharacterized protein n=1 Tax=Bradyrhizobium valentinum TaxID=1518501 RepID=A0A0R3M3U6_9BRAD|nr:hypothetical protein CQ10_37025 [Bradyrhizobium valentinum]KRR14745.1 hypothetical protein CP49_31005 [Bradyrhizobium valentinum]